MHLLYLRKFIFIIQILFCHNSKPAFIRALFLCIFLSLWGQVGYAQKYIFTHYDIEDGLVQSQVNRLAEDKDHRLWIGTLGGACSWNGKEFTALTKEHGLNSNFIFSLFNDSQNNLWVGTSAGLSVYAKGSVKNYALPLNLKRSSVTCIAEDRDRQIWLVLDNQLCQVSGKIIRPVIMPYDIQGAVTTITTNAAGVLCVVVHGKGVYRLNGKLWETVTRFNEANNGKIFQKILFDRAKPMEFFLMADDALLKFGNNTLKPYEPALLLNSQGTYTCIQQDKNFDLWIGTTSGAYRISRGKLTVFNATNGFTNQFVADIYNDTANNLWFGVGGNGMYKYEGDDYVTFNNLPGKQSNMIVMGFARQPSGNILLGADNGGVLQYDGKTLKPFWMARGNSMGNFVQCMHTDKQGVIWMGANKGGLWRCDQKQFVQIKETDGLTVSSIASDTENTIWIAGPPGCAYLEKGSNVIKAVKGINSFCSSILPLNKDSVLIGGVDGLKLVVNKQWDRSFAIDVVNSSAVYCMLRYRKYLLVGTDDRGIVMVDLKTRQTKRCSTIDGLNSDIIYSLTADKYGMVWAGTGRGVNRVRFIPNRMAFAVIGGATERSRIVEANQNAILYDNDHVFLGTTKGVSIYKCKSDDTQAGIPHLIIRHIEININKGNKKEKPVSYHTGDRNRRVLVMNYNQNQLKFSYLGIYLKNPESVYYRYKLIGSDSSFSEPVKTTDVAYPSLPPGDYTFVVKAGTSPRLAMPSEATFHFVIEPPFYQTLSFKVAGVFTLILFGVLLQYNYTNRKARRKLQIEVMRKQEKNKIRQQTAEDFHDDLGNKLTRISVLSDILDAKVKGNEDQQNLVKQIKLNVDALYKGTRDILWALDPKTDNLHEVMLHVKDFGRELFEDTAVTFIFDDLNPDLGKIKLPMEYCRNLTMICKELFNNTLRHAHADRVRMGISLEEENLIKIVITDNGEGFDTSKTYSGRGLNNINKRILRINGNIVITSDQKSGTGIKLRFKLPKSKQV
jgi:ligand-binding sensor domain-containing protein/signal transduction histidine kinase